MSENDAKIIKISRPNEEPTEVEPAETAVLPRAKSDPVPTVPGEVEGGSAAAPEPTLEDAMKHVEENRDRWMRSVAELENFKKRSATERNRLVKYKNEDLLRDLLPIIDNMERALTHCEIAGRSDPFVDGVCMILGMFRDVLKRYGVTEVSALGEAFDPYRHEALMRVPVPDKDPNTVVGVLEKGYLYQDRLLRAAKVSVSARPEPEPEAQC